MNPNSKQRTSSGAVRRRTNPSETGEERLAPVRYKLTKLTQAQTLLQIAEKTEGFYTMSVNSADWIQRDVRSREFSSFGSYKPPSIINFLMLETIVGEDDYYLKLTMKKHKVDYICHDMRKNEFQFWGEYQCCIKAMNEMRYRIHKVSQRAELQDKQPVKFEPEQEVGNQTPEWEWARETDAPMPSTPSYSPTSPSYCPQSPVFIPESSDWSAEPANEPANEPTNNYSTVATNQMAKMGFVPGTGLGRNSGGRTEPIDAVNELGGRKQNNHFGLGFTEAAEPSEPTSPSELTPPFKPKICIHNYTQYYNEETDRMPSLFNPCDCQI